ncbi:TonB-dependent receptor [uncultured Croceicoccus sp.]|uniref:TonB-dependent receptor n=1 Tax=uncultured Croceicoccus sp. TaxID=1295329 RepID=UPI0026229AA5|nr:TonB-dependent receptor [uncultured Croceicoccus sp.]
MTKRQTFRSTLLSATVLAMAGHAAHASAQDANAGTMINEPAGDTYADTIDGAIVVTGTRRSTTIQDTPINISAIDAEELASKQIEDVRDIADFTPGMTISDTGPGSTGSIVLRGLNASGVDDFGAGYDDSLGIYLGEVPLFYDFKLIDIDRVETLLGPQGTLYGLGTLAGAIRYIPNRPDVTGFEGEFHGRAYAKSHSDDFGYQADGMVNIPIVRDHVAFRSATGYYFDPGFIDYPLLVQEPGVSLPQPDGPDGVTQEGFAENLRRAEDLNFERTFTTRNQLLFQTTEDLKLILTYAYQKTDTDGAQANSFGVLGTGRYENASRFIEPISRNAHLASAEVNANIGDFVDIVATGAYTEVNFEGQADVTDLLLDLDYDYELFPAFAGYTESINQRKQKNAEIRFVSSHGGPLSWVLGGFFKENKYQSDYAERVPNHPWVGPDNPEALEYVSYITSEVTEKAIFGEATFEITPEFQVTAGTRYFDYESEISGAAALPLLGDPLSPYDLPANGGQAGQDGWVWKFNSSYEFTPDLMVYGTYSKGYRIGGPNRVAPCPADIQPGQQIICALPDELQYGPDTTKNLELGVRTQLFDRMLSLNFNVFQIKWDGIQVDSATLYGATGITVNGGQAKSEGFEASFQLRPVRGLSIQGNYSYTDARLTEDIPGILTIRETPGDYSNRFVQLDAMDGDRLPGSAKNAGSIGATYVQPLTNGDLIANWTTVYRGDVVSRLGWERAYGELIPSYVTHRARLTYDTDKFSIGLFANNIFDKYAIVSVANDRSRIGINDGVAVRYYRQVVLNPRTVGIEGRVKF